MKLLEELAAASREQHLRFLVAGGHAVAAHGYSRTTADLDLLISALERDPWLAIVAALGFQPHNDGGYFVQFNPPPGQPWPLDFMLVSEESFQKMYQDAKSITIASIAARVPSLEHLLALKFHALKHGGAHRRLGDMDDVLHLIESNRMNVKDGQFRALVLKYADAELYEKLARTAE